MPSMKDFVDAYGVRRNTIRRWSKDFADFLSAGANPPLGERRRYTEGDAVVIALIAVMRADNQTSEKIRAALDAGERGQWPPEGYQPTQTKPGGSQLSTEVDWTLINELTRQAAILEGELKGVVAERDHLRERVGELETRANLAEARLMLLEAPEDNGEDETPEETPPANLTRRAWWRFWE